jgi:hypothetical protein
MGIYCYTLWFSSDTTIISHEKKYSVIICNNRVFKVTPQNKSFSLWAIHKRRLLKGRGRVGKKCRNLHSKKRTKWEGGGHKIGKIG